MPTHEDPKVINADKISTPEVPKQPADGVGVALAPMGLATALKDALKARRGNVEKVAKNEEGELDEEEDANVVDDDDPEFGANAPDPLAGFSALPKTKDKPADSNAKAEPDGSTIKQTPTENRALPKPSTAAPQKMMTLGQILKLEKPPEEKPKIKVKVPIKGSITSGIEALQAAMNKDRENAKARASADAPPKPENFPDSGTAFEQPAGNTVPPASPLAKPTDGTVPLAPPLEKPTDDTVPQASTFGDPSEKLTGNKKAPVSIPIPEKVNFHSFMEGKSSLTSHNLASLKEALVGNKILQSSQLNLPVIKKLGLAIVVSAKQQHLVKAVDNLLEKGKILNQAEQKMITLKQHLFNNRNMAETVDKIKVEIAALKKTIIGYKSSYRQAIAAVSQDFSFFARLEDLHVAQSKGHDEQEKCLIELQKTMNKDDIQVADGNFDKVVFNGIKLKTITNEALSFYKEAKPEVRNSIRDYLEKPSTKKMNRLISLVKDNDKISKIIPGPFFSACRLVECRDFLKDEIIKIQKLEADAKAEDKPTSRENEEASSPKKDIKEPSKPPQEAPPQESQPEKQLSVKTWEKSVIGAKEKIVLAKEVLSILEKYKNAGAKNIFAKREKEFIEKYGVSYSDLFERRKIQIADFEKMRGQTSFKENRIINGKPEEQEVDQNSILNLKDIVSFAKDIIVDMHAKASLPTASQEDILEYYKMARELLPSVGKDFFVKHNLIPIKPATPKAHDESLPDEPIKLTAKKVSPKHSSTHSDSSEFPSLVANEESPRAVPNSNETGFDPARLTAVTKQLKPADTDRLGSNHPDAMTPSRDAERVASISNPVTATTSNISKETVEASYKNILERIGKPGLFEKATLQDGHNSNHFSMVIDHGNNKQDMITRTVDPEKLTMKVTLSRTAKDETFRLFCEMNKEFHPLTMTKACGDPVIVLKLMEAAMDKGVMVELNVKDKALFEMPENQHLKQMYEFLQNPTAERQEQYKSMLKAEEGITPPRQLGEPFKQAPTQSQDIQLEQASPPLTLSAKRLTS